ncbi:MAG TPA: hypothetical protein VKR42_07080 [Ktedonobacteraceae bacterium]|nr:hypothetical protein [Ktedonobacteraceae bacterium]
MPPLERRTPTSALPYSNHPIIPAALCRLSHHIHSTNLYRCLTSSSHPPYSPTVSGIWHAITHHRPLVSTPALHYRDRDCVLNALLQHAA